MIGEVRAFEGGYCRQLLALVDRRSWRLVRFPAVFFALRHPCKGWVLVDTGYGAHFAAATQRFPARFYRWATPVTTAGSTAGILASAGVDPDAIRHIVVTHFHADHIGGLSEFEKATIHFHGEALEPLQKLPAWRQVRAAFLAKLVPPDLPAKANAISRAKFFPSLDLPFPEHDLFGDRSVRLIELPGHAPGQIGVAWTGSRGTELYVADAFWRKSQLDDGIEPSALAMRFQWDRSGYRKTVRLLREVRRAGRYHIIACHDEGTSRQLNNPP